MVRIPEGYFQMGSEIGQDNERPVHKVYIDAFDLAACQVTNADYAQFLEAAEHPKPPALGRSEIQSPESTGSSHIVVRRLRLLHLAHARNRPPLSSTKRSRMGARRPRRSRRKSLPVGR